MIRNFIFCFAFVAVGCVSSATAPTPSVIAVSDDQSDPHVVDAAQFLGAEAMHGTSHNVLPNATLVGPFIQYTIETPEETMVVIGTEAAKVRIREIYATEVLKARSTAGTMLNAVKDRTENIVETPIRVGGTLVRRAEEIQSADEAIIFIPKQVGQAAVHLINGVGELAVTGVRITSGAADTQCAGVSCLGKMGQDVWSGMNSLAGKHNASRRLHSEFGTDPDTSNLTYRSQIDRVAYADAYVSTSMKLGMGQAGIDYVSPAFTGVGYYNNGEFVGHYEDARRQRNREKAALISWGVAPTLVDEFYQNEAYTKQYRRRLFAALDIISDKSFALELFYQSANVQMRHVAESRVVTYEYIAKHGAANDVSTYVGTAPAPLFISADGTFVLPVYADYLTWTSSLSRDVSRLSRLGEHTALHVLGVADETVTQQAAQLGVQVVIVPFETHI